MVIDRVEGAEIGQPVRTVAELEEASGASHPDRAGVLAQASQQAHHRDHGKPDTPGRPPPDRQGAQRPAPGSIPPGNASVPTPWASARCPDQIAPVVVAFEMASQDIGPSDFDRPVRLDTELIDLILTPRAAAGRSAG